MGDVNLYALFAESLVQLIGTNGRAGIITPAGIATDDTTKIYFEFITSTGRLQSLIGFENEEFIFPAVHHSFRFCLMLLRTEQKIEAPAKLTFFLRKVQQIGDGRRQFSLSSNEFALLNPNTRTCPVFRSQADAELTKKIYRRVPVLIDESKGDAGNPWGISFMRMLDMSNDSGLFRTAAQLTVDGAQRDGPNWIGRDRVVWVPLYEAKMIHQFDHRWATYEDNGIDSRDMTDIEKRNPASFAQPRYWVREGDKEAALEIRSNRQWLLGWRDITSAHVLRTVIAGIAPRVGIGHKMPLLFCANAPSVRHLIGLYGNLNALALDFVARQKVGGTSLTYHYMKQFPVLPPNQYTPHDLDFIAPRVVELTYTANDLEYFARDLGYKGLPFEWNPERRAVLRAELDAYYAKLYSLSRDELRYILDPADVYGDDYPSETFRVLKNNEVRQFGEYRTRRLVLEAWDRIANF